MGGAVLLILLIGALCILLWRVIINYRKRKTARYFESVHYSQSATSQGHRTLNRYLTTNMEADSTIKQRNCKCSGTYLCIAIYVHTYVYLCGYPHDTTTIVRVPACILYITASYVPKYISM